MQENVSAQVYDFSTGKEMVEIRNTNRKTFHLMKDGTMTSYFSKSQKSGFKERTKKALRYFFELDE